MFASVTANMKDVACYVVEAFQEADFNVTRVIRHAISVSERNVSS